MANIFNQLPTLRRVAGISGISPTGEPQKQCLWEIRVIGGIVASLGDIRFYAKTANIPQRSIDIIETEFAGRKYTYNGKENSPRTLQVTFWDDQNLTIYNFFRQWMDVLSNQDTGAAISKKEASATVNIKLKDTSDVIETLNVNLLNSYPSEISDIPLTYESGDPIEITVTFVFDEQSVDNVKKLGNIQDKIRDIIS